jgi:ABC-type lipoprotein release transport system permease subunit
VSFLRDVAYAARSFARTPVLALALLLSIALGIGSNASVLGFIRGLVVRDLPLPDVGNLVSLYGRGERDAFVPLSWDDYLSVKEGAAVFERLGAVREAPQSFSFNERAGIAAVAVSTPDIAELLPLPLRKGVVISQAMVSAGVGDVRPTSKIRIGQAELSIGGFAPGWLEGLYSGRTVDLWVPVDEAAVPERDRTNRTWSVLGRLRHGVSVREAQAAVDAARASGPAISVIAYTGVTPEVAHRLGAIGRLLMAATVVVFVVACANVAVFLLSRASGRSQETSVRVALGASRRRLGRQLLADSVLLAAGGTAAGLLLASWTSGIVPALFFVADAGRLVFTPNFAAVAAAAAVCALLMIATALLPLLEVRDDDPARVLRRESGGPSNTMRRLRAGLVVGQMTCCCVLVIAAGLLAEGFRSSLRTAAGDRLGAPMIATLQYRPDFDRPDLGRTYFRRAEEAMRELHGITHTAWVGSLPGSRPVWYSFRIEPPRIPSRELVMDGVALTPARLETLKLPAVAGRLFGGRDTPASCPAVVVNEEAAREVFDGQALGRVIEDRLGRRAEIVGVVAGRDDRDPVPRRPAIFYYPEQMPQPFDRDGPVSFKLPVPAEPLVTGLLDAAVVSPSYFDAMGFVVVAGRGLPREPTPCRVAVVNQEAAERYFGGNAVDAAVIDELGRRTEIVGVIQSPLLRASQRPVEPTIYLPMSQNYQPRMTLILGTPHGDRALLASVRRQLEAVAGGTLLEVTTLDDHLGRTAFAAERIATVLVAASAAIAIAIGILGMYGAMADAARQRRREIALRIALGAPGWRIVRGVVVEGLRLAAVGVAVGLALSVIVAWWMGRVAPGASVPAVWIWVAAPAVLVLVVLAAGVMPARRALAIDPLTIMRA